MAGFCLLLLSKREAGLGGVAFRIAAGRYADGERAAGAKGVHADFSKRGGQGYVFQSEAHVESPLADGFKGIRQGDRLQITAALKSIICDGRDSTAERDIFQMVYAHAQLEGDGCDAFRKDERLEGGLHKAGFTDFDQ